MKDALAGLLRQQADGIRELCAKELPNLPLDQAVVATVEARVRADAIRLPDTFFTLPQPVTQTVETKDEKVGQIEGTRTTGTCWKSTETYYEDKVERVAYRVVQIPGADEMARQWADGIKFGEDALWDRLCGWMTTALNESAAAFSADIDGLLDLTQRALDEQQRALDREHDELIVRWTQIEESLRQTSRSRQVLQKLAAPGTQRRDS